MMPIRVWAAFGRNDIRGTYRDPLLIMVVLAPIIWTTGVAVLTPRATDLLSATRDSTWFRTTRWC